MDARPSFQYLLAIQRQEFTGVYICLTSEAYRLSYESRLLWLLIQMCVPTSILQQRHQIEVVASVLPFCLRWVLPSVIE
jgi:hypothetical protein